MVGERRLDLFLGAWQCHPGLNAEHLAALRPQFARGALGMNDAAARGHPVQLAGADRLHRAEAVAVQDLAAEQIGHRGEADVGMRPDVESAAGAQQRRPHLVEENEWPDHAALLRRQRPADGKAVAEVGAARHDDGLDGGGILFRNGVRHGVCGWLMLARRGRRLQSRGGPPQA
jgi:hypothetical protein